jgi:hypothetical protein
MNELELEYGEGEGSVIFGFTTSRDDFLRNRVTLYAQTSIPNNKILAQPELPEKVKKDLFDTLSRATSVFNGRKPTMTEQDERDRLLGVLIKTWIREGNEVVLRNKRGEFVTLELEDDV